MINYVWVKKGNITYLATEYFEKLEWLEVEEILSGKLIKMLNLESIRVVIEKNSKNKINSTLVATNIKFIEFMAPLYVYDTQSESYIKEAVSYSATTIDPRQYIKVQEIFEWCRKDIE